MSKIIPSYVARGYSDERLAEWLGITLAEARKLKAGGKREAAWHEAEWSEGEVTALVEGRKQRKTLKEIARDLERSVKAVSRKSEKLRKQGLI